MHGSDSQAIAHLVPDKWGAACERASAWLDQWPRWQFILFSTGVALALSVFSFSPKLWLLAQPTPGSFEWDRALSFLRQCHDPFTADVEGAMRWRLLPPLVARATGLSGYWPLMLPWIGLALLCAQWTAATERLLGDRLAACALTVVLGTSAACISVTTLLGLNDAWFLLGLVAVCTGRSSLGLILAGLLCPWVDERFLLGWPAAMFCRWWLQDRPGGYVRQGILATASLLPYVLTRAGFALMGVDRGAGDFFADGLGAASTCLPYLRIGWWMGFRLAWVLPLCAFLYWWREERRRVFFIGIALVLAGWGAITLLAADISRSTNLLLPLLLCGAVAFQRLTSLAATRIGLVALATANLVVPYQWVTFNKVMPAWSLPMELFRLLRNHL